MDGKGRCMDNIFVERLWRSLKYEEVYLHAYATVAEAKAGIGARLDFYNRSASTRVSVIARRGKSTSKAWGYGDDRLADRLRFPGFPSELGKPGKARRRPHTHRRRSQQGT
jgi:transposase InsO family protein